MKSLWHSLQCLMLLILIVGFQNCSPGFISKDGFSSEASLGLENQAAIEGKALYDNACASCHGELSASTKRDRSAFEIANAIKGVSQMSSIALSSSDLNKISYVLAAVPNGSIVQKKFTCTLPNQRGSANPAVRRMSSSEIKATLPAILGSAIMGDAQVKRALSILPGDNLTNVYEYVQDPSDEIAQVLLTVADRVMVMMDSDATLRASKFGNCSSQVPVADTCLKTFIANTGAFILRRPVSAAETQKYLDIYKNSGGGVTGFESIYFVLLQAPEMSLHIEEGLRVEGGRVRLTDYEIANRISYRTTGTAPDAVLRAAAAKGELQDLKNVKLHVKRLVTASSLVAKTRVSSFFSYYAGLGEINDPSPTVAAARGVGTTGGLGASMLRELDEFEQGEFWKPTGDFKDFMLTPDSYPRSEAMRTILATPAFLAKTDTAPQASSTNLGFLHRPALLTNDGGRTNPVLRGAHLRQRYLCEPIPEPPIDLVNQAVLEAGDIEAQTNRGKYKQLTNSPSCIGCHSKINPVGFAFEGFDQLGMSRKIETLYSDAGVVTSTYPLDTRVRDPKLNSDEAAGTVLADSIEISRAIANGSKGRSCFAQRAFEFMTVRPYAEVEDGCALSEMEDTAKAGTLQDVYVNSIANEDLFWRKGAGQ